MPIIFITNNSFNVPCAHALPKLILYKKYANRGFKELKWSYKIDYYQKYYNQ